jgi:N-acyl amino acid synthase of PEP-CTERM/exosortase system
VFDETFDTFVADTRLSKSIHYNLRYQVYCLERRFENPAAFPDRQETDNYDKNSVHFIVRHRESGQWIGAMRLVLAVPGQLPLTRVSTIDDDSIKALAGTMVAEASRLCVVPAAIPDSEQKLTSGALRDIIHPSSVTLGLIRAAREYCLGHDIRFSFFLITDQLARILQRVGMEIKSVGPATDHRGLRRPYIHDNKEGYNTMRDKSPLVYDMFQASPVYKYHSKLQIRKQRQASIQIFAR